MELVKILVKNFLSIKAEETIKINSTITTIIGLNESGKTTLLKAIEKLNGKRIMKNEKNKSCKNEDSYITGIFLLTKDEVIKINKDSKNSIILLPEEELYVYVTVKDENDTRYYSLYKKVGKNAEYLDINEYLKVKILEKINNIYNKYKQELDEGLKEQLEDTNFNELTTIVASAIDSNTNEKIIEELTLIQNELENSWIDLVPKFKIVKFSSTQDILKDEVPLASIKENIQVNNLLKISEIDANELIESVANDDNEELQSYEGTYKENITKMFKRIFRQNDKNFNFQIRIDSKNEKILFYTYDNTSGNSPIPLKNRSDGFKWYFSIYITLYEYLQRKDKTKYILLFDEPNLYLNPSAQYDLLERVFKKEFKNEQIIYSTHNPYMIDTTNFSSIRIVEKNDSSKFYNTTSDYLKEHKVIANEVDPLTPILTALNLDVSNNLIIDRKKICVVVEGIQDIYIVNSMIKKLKLESSFKNISFVPCFGAEKVSTMYGYLYGMGYKVFTLVDNDMNGINALKTLMGEDKENSVLYDTLLTYNMEIDEEKDFKLESLFSGKMIKDYLTPKNTVVYRDFYNNIGKLAIDKSTQDNFKNLFENLIQKLGIKIDK